MSKELNNKMLYSLDSKGKIREWKASTDLSKDSTGYITITIEHGQQDGKKQLKERKVKAGKNKGKANETSIEEQAYLEIGYLYQKQLDQGYVFDIASYKIPKRPMLAYKYKEKAHKVVWSDDKSNPGILQYASRKLNGIRCFIFVENGIPTLFESRTGKAFKYFNHIADDIKTTYFENKNYILDGELFHPDIPFEIICSLVNSDDYTEVLDPETGITWSTKDIRFYCYDRSGQDETETFYERFIKSNWYHTESKSVYLVESVAVLNEEEMIALALKWIKEGFEGLMLRAGNGIYEFGKRSIFLLKFKVMEQEEFKVFKIYLAENDENKVMVTLHNHHNKEEPYNKFDCAIKGNKDLNLEYYKNKVEYEEKAWMTVDYQVLSSYRVPLFPVGIVIRKGEIINDEFVPAT